MDELKELPAWLWAPGMLGEDGKGRKFRVIEYGERPKDFQLRIIHQRLTTTLVQVDGKYAPQVVVEDGGGNLTTLDDLTPVLDDPATMGCLLALVREAHGDPKACCVWVDLVGGMGSNGVDGCGEWMCDVHNMEFEGASEGGAMLAALRALNEPE